MGTDADNATLIKILSGILAHVRNIAREFLHTALGLPDFKGILVDMHGSKDILTHHALVEHDSILIVITLPRHERHFQVSTQGKLTLLSGITLCQDIAALHTLTHLADRTEVDRGALVGTAELRNLIFLCSRLKFHVILILGTVILDSDDSGIYEFNYAGTLRHNLSAGVADELSLDTGANDRSLATQQRHSLAHHVRTHQRTVSIIMLKERDKRSRN